MKGIRDAQLLRTVPATQPTAIILDVEVPLAGDVHGHATGLDDRGKDG